MSERKKKIRDRCTRGALDLMHHYGITRGDRLYQELYAVALEVTALVGVGQPEAPTAAPLGTVWRKHELKTDPEVFQAVLDGTKTYEIRLNDRGFAVGDVLVLRETLHTGRNMAMGSPMVYTGRTIERRVSHMLTGPIYGLVAGWSILSLAAHPPARSGATPKRDHCPEKLKPGGCQLHNLHCGYPKCNEPPDAGSESS